MSLCMRSRWINCNNGTVIIILIIIYNKPTSHIEAPQQVINCGSRTTDKQIMHLRSSAGGDRKMLSS